MQLPYLRSENQQQSRLSLGLPVVLLYMGKLLRLM